jgi:lipopolysaccharide/colanic/teichoic acid biosynthesis glycosyltransferase
MLIRLFDVVFSAIALVVFSPLLVLIMLLLKLSGEGEVFFLQARVGKNRETFKLYKFATMVKNSPNIGTGTVTLHKDPRILPLGGWLRHTKINELPQLINIFKGNMSVIGPRPQTQRCFDAFPVSAQKEIVKVRPGLSGVGSIIFRNEEQMMYINNDPGKFYNGVVMPYKGRLEQWYVANQNIWSYFILMGLTVWVTLFPSSSITWRILKDVPQPPQELKKWM